MHYLHHSALLNNGLDCLALFGVQGYITYHLQLILPLKRVCTFEVGAIPAPFSLAQQWVRICKHCWFRLAGLKYEVGYGTMENKACSLLHSKKCLKALVA
jgi:hypothetical protein